MHGLRLKKPKGNLRPISEQQIENLQRFYYGEISIKIVKGYRMFIWNGNTIGGAASLIRRQLVQNRWPGKDFIRYDVEIFAVTAKGLEELKQRGLE